ncbi:hypothetical protein V2J09_022472 [Rumex salicifolius]
MTNFFPTNESSIGLARILNVTLSEKEVKYSIQTKVAPVLFQAVSTIPNLAQISFVGIDGVYFSLSSADNRITALYTNGSSRKRFVFVPQMVHSIGFRGGRIHRRGQSHSSTACRNELYDTPQGG